MIKKLVSLITLACFLSCSAGSETLLAVMGPTVAATPVATRFGDSVIPPGAGRITDGKDFGSKPLVIAVQDLHCHPEVQRNIAKILAALDTKYSLGAVYVEGGYGQVDTSWLSDIDDNAIRNKITEGLVNRGLMTGAEYYSVTARRPQLLRGLEDEKLHKENLVRLGRIIEKKEYFENRLRALDKDLVFMGEKYFGPKNKKFSCLIKKHQDGQISSDKYYTLLGKYVDAVNNDPDRYNTLFSIRLDDFPNIKSYITLSRTGRRLDYKRVAREMQAFLRDIKNAVPYRVYAGLLKKTDNFAKLDELYLHLIVIAREYHIDVNARYPDLARFLAYSERSRTLNPVQMINEEKKLAAELRMGFSRDTAELEVAFLADFYPLFKDYLLNRLTADDYEYFRQRFEKFQSVWAKYTFKDRIAELSGEFPLLDEFYAANCERNRCFLDRAGSVAAARPADERGQAGDLMAQPQEAIDGLLKRSDIAVMVTGGFHTEGLRKLFSERGISYVTVTPNVTQDTTFSSAVYIKLAREQAKILANAIQLGLLAQTSLKEKYRLALEGVTPDQIPAVLKALTRKTGIRAEYKDGVVTLDNGTRFKVEENKETGQVMVSRASPLSVLSDAVRAALEGLVQFEQLAAAVARIYATGNADELIILAMKVAAEYDLITGNGLASSILNDPALKDLDLIHDIQPELLARIPIEIQDAIAAYQKNSFALDTAEQREKWLKILFAVDLLREFISRVPVFTPPAQLVTEKEAKTNPVVADILSNADFSPLARQSIERHPDYFAPGKRLLSLGSGNGNDERYFADLGLEVTATDNNEEMLTHLKKKAEEGLPFTVQLADAAEKLPFPDGSFDIVYVRLVLHYFNNTTQAQALREIQRVLAPNGIAVIQVKTLNDALFKEKDKEQLADGMVYFPSRGFSRNHISKEDLENKLTAVGLTPLESEEHLERLYSNPYESSLGTVLAVKAPQPVPRGSGVEAMQQGTKEAPGHAGAVQKPLASKTVELTHADGKKITVSIDDLTKKVFSQNDWETLSVGSKLQLLSVLPSRPAELSGEWSDLSRLIDYYKEKFPEFKKTVETDTGGKTDFDYEDILGALFPLRERFFSDNVLAGVYPGGEERLSRSAVTRYRSFINDMPAELRPMINNIFRENFTVLNWNDALKGYLHQAYGYDGNYEIINVADHSMTRGGYKLTLRLSERRHALDVEVLVKGGDPRQADLRNERAYWESERLVLKNEYGKNDYLSYRPFYFHGPDPQSPALLVSPLIGKSSLEGRLQELASSDSEDETALSERKELLRKIVYDMANHAALGDVLGRHDRRLSNTRIDDDGLNLAGIVDLNISGLLDSDPVASEPWYRNYDRILENVRQGISEITLLTLLEEYAPFNAGDARLREKAELFRQWKDLYLKKRNEITSPTNRRKIEGIIKSSFRETPDDAANKIDVFRKWIRIDPEIFLKNIFRAQLIDYETRELYLEYLQQLKNKGVSLGALEVFLAHMNQDAPLSGRLEAFGDVYTETFLELRRMTGRKPVEAIFAEIESLVAGHLGGRELDQLKADVRRINKNASFIIEYSFTAKKSVSAVAAEKETRTITKNVIHHLDEMRAAIVDHEVPAGSILYIDFDDTFITVDGVATSRFISRRYHMIEESVRHNIEAYRKNFSDEEFRQWYNMIRGFLLPMVVNEYIEMEKKELRQNKIHPVDGILPLLEAAKSRDMRVVIATNRSNDMRGNIVAILQSMGVSFDDADILTAGNGKGAKAKMIAKDAASRAPPAVYFVDDSSNNIKDLERTALPRGTAVHLYQFDLPLRQVALSPAAELRQELTRGVPADTAAWETLLGKAIVDITQIKDNQGNPETETQLKMMGEVLDIIEANGLNNRDFITGTDTYQYLYELIEYLLYIVNVQSLLSASHDSIPLPLQIYFRIVFPFNYATAFAYYKKGKLTLDELPGGTFKGREYGAEALMPINANNMFLFLEPILKGIAADRPDMIVLPDTGTRPYYRILRSFIEESGLAEKVKVLLLPSSFHDVGDTKDEIVGRLTLGKLFYENEPDLSLLQIYLEKSGLFPELWGEENEGKLREVASYYKAFFPLASSSKVLLFDDNVGSGKTVEALQEIFARAGVKPENFKAATPLMMGRRGEKYVKYFTSFISGHATWIRWPSQIIIYPSWEEGLEFAERGVKPRQKGEHLVTETPPGSAERTIAEKFNATAKANFVRDMAEQDRKAKGEGARSSRFAGNGEKGKEPGKGLIEDLRSTVKAAVGTLSRSILAWIGFGSNRQTGQEGTVVHIAGLETLRATSDRYPNDAHYSHIWVTGFPSNMTEAEKKDLDLKPVGFNVTIDNRKIATWAGTANGALVFYLDFGGAFAPEAYGAALSRGAAQITAELSGTDNVEGTGQTQEVVRGIAKKGDVDLPDFTPRMIIDHVNNGVQLKRDFSGLGIHRVPVVAAADLEKASGDLNAAIRRRVIRRAALNARMAENKILKMDIEDISEFREAVDIFNAARNGQMLVDWKIFQDVLDNKKLTRSQRQELLEEIQALLKESGENGVLIHVAYKADARTTLSTIQDLRDFGFKQVSLDLSALEGKEAVRLRDELKDFPLLSVTMPDGLASPLPVISLQLDEIGKGRKFPAEAVLDIRVPASLKKEDIADYLQALPLENTIIFHSDDSQKLISTRDLLDRKAFASLFALLVNFGTPAITTPEAARRLGYNWPVIDLPAIKEGDEGREQLQALAAGDLAGAGIAADSAIAEQLQELSDLPLKQAFLNAIIEKMLIKDRLFKEDSTIAEAYVRGTYRFSDPLAEEMLGISLLKEYQADGTDRAQEEKKVEALKARISDEHLPSALLELHRGIKAGKPEPGAVTFVIDTVLQDIISDYNVRKTFNKKKPGTVNIRTVSRVLSAA